MLAVQQMFGTRVSLMILVGVAFYYWKTKREEESIYDEIARMQAQTASKLDALHQGQPTQLPPRQTQFTLSEDHTSIIT